MNKNCIVLVFRIFSDSFGTPKKRISAKKKVKHSGSQDRTTTNQAMQMKQSAKDLKESDLAMKTCRKMVLI